jgi:ABC-type lipoprotein export system ATPase subunit
VRSAEPFVECEGLVHIYQGDGLEVVALQGLELHVERGEMIAIVGRSGSGKTTLMNVLAGVEPPTAGRVVVAGIDLTQLGERARDAYRRCTAGYVWQNARRNASPELTAAENVMLPMLSVREDAGDRRRHAFRLLEAFGLATAAGLRPAELDGAQLQRLGLAIALANQPPLLLADEPTGELDTLSARSLLDDLRALQREQGTTVVTVTHDPQVERHVDRVIQIRDGKTSTETRHRTGGDGRLMADELVIIDRAGRLQVPRAHLERLGLSDRARVHLDGDRLVILRPDLDPGSPDHEATPP